MHCVSPNFITRKTRRCHKARRVGHESSDMLWRHYHRASKRKDAERFWQIRPAEQNGKVVAFAERTPSGFTFALGVLALIVFWKTLHK